MSVLYRVTFRKRFRPDGEDADAPASFLDLADGVVLDSSKVETIEPDNLHVEENMEEDDDFLSLGTEIWDFDVAERAQQEFKDALVNSGMVIEFEELDEEDDDLPADDNATKPATKRQSS
jgi:hypothetical protein